MVKELKEHIRYVEGLIKKNKKAFDWRSLQVLNRTKIGFFQHERLIHLLITMLFGLVLFLDVLGILMTENQGLMILAPVLMIMTVLYVWHYFCLENGVQKLYRLDSEIDKRLNG